jgi:predicted N-acetyltransferase YhbS
VVAEHAGHVVGFSAVAGEPPDAELAFLFVEPEAIGTGVGRALLEHGLEVASALGFRTIRVESDPFAEPFYLRMGAVRVGEAASQSISGRTLPVLRLDVPAPAIRSSRRDASRHGATAAEREPGGRAAT